MKPNADVIAAVEAAVEVARDRLGSERSMAPATLFAPIVMAALDALGDSDPSEAATQLMTLFGFDSDTAAETIASARERSGDDLIQWIEETLESFLPGDDNYDVLEGLVFEDAFHVASWRSFASMTSGGADWDGVEVRGSVYWRMRGDDVDEHYYSHAYDVKDHAGREAAYSYLNEELLMTHRLIETGDATDESEDASFVPVTWPQTEDQG